MAMAAKRGRHAANGAVTPPGEARTCEWMDDELILANVLPASGFGRADIRTVLVALADIDFAGSLKKNPRYTAQGGVSVERRDELARFMEEGRQIPSLVLMSPQAVGGGKYENVSGLHRQAAALKLGYSHVRAHVVPWLPPANALKLRIEANTVHGAQPTREERVLLAVSLIDECPGMTAEQAARTANIDPESVTRRMRARKVMAAAAALDMDFSRVPEPALVALNRIAGDEPVFKAVGRDLERLARRDAVPGKDALAKVVAEIAGEKTELARLLKAEECFLPLRNNLTRTPAKSASPGARIVAAFNALKKVAFREGAFATLTDDERAYLEGVWPDFARTFASSLAAPPKQNKKGA